jgi:hypothetical protein
MVSLHEPPLPSLDNTFIFKNVPWLGGKHDGYPLLSFKDYIRTYPKISTLSSRECVVELQCVLIFRLLEAVMEVKILQSTLLQQGVDNNYSIGGDMNKVFMTSKNFPTLLKDSWNRVRLLGNGEPYQQWANYTQAGTGNAHDGCVM